MMNTKYRADIDGLRALAILLVIAFHASSYRAPGGFIGVDIFFVISGFLISSIIFKHLDKGTFSYADFYARRIKRIFPALLLLLITAWALGYWFLFIYEFEQLGKHIASGIAFVANITLWQEAGYFDNSAESKPLLHLWSLGVEEQFYIVYPLLVAALWRYKTKLIGLIIGLAALSFALNVYWVQTQAVESAFYLPFSRFWEMMVGSYLAYYTLYKNPHYTSRIWLNNIRAMLGLGLILFGFVWINPEIGFPGWWAIFPVLGAALLLMSPQSWINQQVFSRKPMVWIGLISYPLYLWHWLLLSLAYILGLDSGVQRLVAVGISFALAWLTYYFIESHVRYRKGFTVHALIVLSLVLLGLGLLSTQGKIIPKHDSPLIRKAATAIEDWAYPDNLDNVNINGEPVYIKRGSAKAVLFFGDSHIEQYAPRIVQLIDAQPEKMKTAVFATIGACPPMPKVFREHLKRCTPEFKKNIMDYAFSEGVDAVVIGGRWELYLDEKNPYQETFKSFYVMDNGQKKYLYQVGVKEAKEALKSMLTELVAHKKVYLVLDNPDIGQSDPKAFLAKQRFAKVEQAPKESVPYSSRQKKLHDEMKQMAEKLGVVVIDPIPHFCSNQQCRAFLDDGSSIYKDSNHIRASYVRQYVDYIDITVKD